MVKKAKSDSAKSTAKKLSKTKAEPKKPVSKSTTAKVGKAKTSPKSAKAIVEKAAKAPVPVGIVEGAYAPDFTLTDTAGRTHRLSDYKGKRVILYFYPKDNTPGCTIEACDFRDKNTQINATGTLTFGISPDNAASHQKFATKYNLGYTLLCDVEKEVAKKYLVWKLKNNYGQTYWGIERTTFIIDHEGKIAKIFPKVQVQGHVEQVLEVLKGMPKLASLVANT